MIYISDQVTKRHEPELYSLFQRDAEAFTQVITARIARDNEADPTKHKTLQAESLLHLRVSTEIPLKIAQHGLDLSRLALTLFDIGFKSARGDSGAAGSSALSGASSALFVAYLNLKSFRDSTWARGLQKQCDDMFSQYLTVSSEMFSRVTTLRVEALEAQAKPVNAILPMA